MLHRPDIFTLAKTNSDDKSYEYVRSLADVCYSIHSEMNEVTHATAYTSRHAAESNFFILNNEFLCSAHTRFYWHIGSFALRKRWMYASTLSHDMSSK
jgi:hypothetical protein